MVVRPGIYRRWCYCSKMNIPGNILRYIVFSAGKDMFFIFILVYILGNIIIFTFICKSLNSKAASIHSNHPTNSIEHK